MAKTFRNKSMNNVPPVFEKKEINYSGYIIAKTNCTHF